MKNSIYVMLMFLVACGGSGGGGPGQGTAPRISNLQLQDDFAFVMAGNGTSSVFAQLEFNDPDRDLASIQVEISDGSSLVIPVPGNVTEASGVLVGDIIFNTTTRGVFTATVWAVDRNGNQSNRLSVDFSIVIDATNWTQRVSGTLEDLEDIAWNGSQFVAVGGNGTILTSDNSVDWSIRGSGTTSFLNGVMWNGSEYFAVGTAGTILSSPDGIAWFTESASFTDVTLEDIAWSGQLYVAVGSRSSNTVILTSPDGQTWTENMSIGFVLKSISDVVWSGQQFVATTTLGSFPQEAIVLTSTDGLTWVPVTISTDSVSTFSIVWAGDQFIAGGIVGRVFTSPDGVNWNEVTAPRASNLWAGAWSGFTWVAGGHAGHVSTIDGGNTWRSGPLSGFHGIAYGDDKFVAVARGGEIYSTP